ncbi:neuronal acetylcholine receptor subunit alpha-3-like [Haliotis cracherodii]|uniref:neuronal acetylcholine receptor subunit alpha-3-like n=1 Tax=Haliotis cracherodii TaxID=6455 RepID=UPI0039E961DC
MKIRSIDVVVSVIRLKTETTPHTAHDVHRLLDKLFANYSILVRPANDHSNPTAISVDFILNQVEYLDIKTQEMKSLGYFSINWTDEFLVWNQTDYGGTRYITVPGNKIWKPDFVIDNDISAKRPIGDERHLVIIDFNGRILWEPGYVATTTCNVDIKYFPFDTQICSVTLTSWMTSNISLRMYSTRGMYLGYYSENGVYKVTNHWVKQSTLPLTGFENEALDGLDFFVVLKRKTTFYWLCIVSPLLVFPLLSPLSFLVPADSGEKTTLAITSLLSIFVFISSIYETLPNLSNTVSLFVLLASVQTFISFLTVICNVTILCIHRLPPNYTIPMCLKRVYTKGSQTHSGEKTTLAITSLLSIFVFMSSIYETLPKLSNTISIFVLLASVQTFISFLTVKYSVSIDSH